MSEAMPEVTDAELMMINTLTVRPQDREAYVSELRKVLPLARALPGCLVLEIGESIESPGTFVLTERWSSGSQYVGEYLELPFFQNYLASTEAMYAAPRQVMVLSAVATS